MLRLMRGTCNMAKTGSIKITQISQDLVNGTTTFNVYASITTSGESYRGYHNKFILRLNRDSEYILPTWFDTLAGWTVVKDSSGNRLYAYYSVGVPQNTTKQLCNFDVTLKHYSTGTSGTISASFDYADGWCTASTSTKFTSIPRTSTLTIPKTGVLGVEMEMSVTKNYADFTHTITYSRGDMSGTICEKSKDTTIKWTPPIELASTIPKTKSAICTIKIETFNGNTSLGSTQYSMTLYTPATLVPIIDDVYIADANGFNDSLGGYVQGKSRVIVTVTARGVYGSTITGYEIMFEDTKYTDETSITNPIKGKGEIELTCRVYDSRGNPSELKTFKLNVLEYYSPKITKLSAMRCDAHELTPGVFAFDKYNPQGAYFSVECECDYADLNGQRVHYTLDYKKTSETDYERTSYYNVPLRNYVFIIPADVYSTYNLLVTVTDELEYAQKETIGYSARKLFDIWKTKFSIAFGKIAELENAFEVLFENIKLTGRTKVSIEGKDIDIVPSGRLYYKGANFFGQKLIWSGNSLMTEVHSITLSTPINQMKNGIVLTFGRDGAYNTISYFVPKESVVSFGRTGWCFPLCTALFDYIGSKTIYISNEKLEGHESNDATGKNATSGITYHNEAFYLKYVYEV